MESLSCLSDSGSSDKLLITDTTWVPPRGLNSYHSQLPFDKFYRTSYRLKRNFTCCPYLPRKVGKVGFGLGSELTCAAPSVAPVVSSVGVPGEGVTGHDNGPEGSRGGR